MRNYNQIKKILKDAWSPSYYHISKKSEFIDKLSFYICELNVLHPFNEGNGRAKIIF